MIKELVALANHFDSKGLTKEADFVDSIIKKSSLSQTNALPSNLKDVSSEIDAECHEEFRNYIYQMSRAKYKRKGAISQDQISVKKMKREKTDKRDEFIYCAVKCSDEDCVGKVRSIMSDPKALQLLSKCCGIKAPQFPTFYQDENVLYFAKKTNQ